MSLTAEALERFVVDLAANASAWRGLVRHDGDARVYAEIHADEDVSAWVICWSAEQDTGFHDHDQSAAAIAVIEGHVREERLTVGGRPLAREVGPGGVVSIPPVAIHRVLHAGVGPAVTIHAYSPPLTRTGAYRIGPDGQLEREALDSEVELRAA